MMMRVAELAPLPRGYGVAWVEPHTMQAVCLPVPFNLVAGWCRRLLHGLRVGLSPSALDAAYLEGWKRRGECNYHEMRARVLADLHREHVAVRNRLVQEIRAIARGEA